MAGAIADGSSTKSPRELSSSSPTGVSSDTGSSEMRWMSRTRSGVSSTFAATSSTVGSRPSSWSIWRCTRSTLFIVSTMCTGMRMVRAWSAMARVMAWRIHHVA